MTHNTFTYDAIKKVYALIREMLPLEYEEERALILFLHDMCKRSDPYLQRRFKSLGETEHEDTYRLLEVLQKRGL